MTELTFREPPHNLDAEQALLGAMLVNNEAYERVSDFLEPGQFVPDLGELPEVGARLVPKRGYPSSRLLRLVRSSSIETCRGDYPGCRLRYRSGAERSPKRRTGEGQFSCGSSDV